MSGRPELPELQVRAPECPMCYGDTSWDDGFHCKTCQVYWPSQLGAAGEPLDSTAGQCRKVLTYSAYPNLSGRCILPDTHTSDHCNGNINWRSAWLATFLAETEVDE